MVVEAGKIKSVGQATQGRVSYDFPQLTLLPGLIDTHVHIDTHFGKSGRATAEGETPQESMLYAAENAYAMLNSGFTTTQSLGSPLDRDAAGCHCQRDAAWSASVDVDLPDP